MSTYTKRAVVDLAKAECIAEQLLDVAGVSKPPVPDNLVSFFDPSRPVIVSARKLGAIRALLMPEPDHWLIILNSTLGRGARRFALMHEGFHILQRTGAIEGGHGEEYNEWLADGFAARLLMPRRWMLELGARCSEEELAARFRVSYTALDRRLKELATD
jgi:Zn-dependent peptidase ImmA (M78 family)